jgi:arylsulfatase A-like enzyme
MAEQERMRARRVTPLLLVLALVLGGCGREAPPPTVVLITIDTLRPDYLGFGGYPRETAPFLASLAGRSTLFERAFSTSTWTAPATASLFTAVHPKRHGVTQGFFAHLGRVLQLEREGSAAVPINRIHADLETLPERFRRYGYQTLGLASNINIGPEIGFDRGFDRFERLHRANADELFDRLKEWEPQMARDRPRLIYLHFNDVHQPYEKRAPWYEPGSDHASDEAAAYRSEISYLDDVLRKMFGHFRWVEDDAVVAVVSDHGEEFMEHGRIGHNPTLYRELLQILLMVRAPQHGLDGRARVRDNVTINDVLPTLSAVAGFEPDGRWEGRSLLGPAATGANGDRILYGHRQSNGPPLELWTAVHRDWHLIRAPRGPELFDFRKDPLERANRAPTEPEVLARLGAALDAFASRSAAPAESSEYQLDPKRLEDLKSLGYVE